DHELAVLGAAGQLDELLHDAGAVGVTAADDDQRALGWAVFECGWIDERRRRCGSLTPRAARALRRCRATLALLSRAALTLRRCRAALSGNGEYQTNGEENGQNEPESATSH